MPVVPAIVEKKIRQWHRLVFSWKITHLFLAIISIASAAAIAAFISFLGGLHIAILAWVSTVSSSLLYILSPGERSRNIRQAWTKLSKAAERFKNEEMTKKALIEQMFAIEEAMGDPDVVK